jgi:hypothetical protein
MSSRTKIPVGNGKYCYSGPECRIHGELWKQTENTTKVSQGNTATFSELLVSLDKMNQVTTEHFNQAVHSYPAVKNIAELGESALMPGQAARTCSEHKGYHVYPTTVFDDTNKFIGQSFAQIASSVEAGVLSTDDAKILRKRLGPESHNYDYKTDYKQDRKNLRTLQSEFANLEEAEAALLERKRHRIEERLKQQPIKTATEREQPALLVDQSAVSDSHMLEYWRCGRKRKFETVDAGDAMIDQLGERETMSVYACEYCSQQHIGHGFGRDPLGSQFERAREHWNKYPEKSNPFAFTKGLTD